MKELRKIISYLILVLFLFSSSAMFLYADEIYKWVDEDGGVHYSKNPPNKNKANKVEIDSSNKSLPNKDDDTFPKNNSTPVVDIDDTKNLETKLSIPPQTYKSFYKNHKRKYFYSTANGLRVNPTLEYYNNGELKRKWSYGKNILEEPIKIDGLIVVNQVEVIEEHFDTLTMKVAYEFLKTSKKNKRSWLNISPKPFDNFSSNKIMLDSGKNSINLTKKLSHKALNEIDSGSLQFRIYDFSKKEWLTLGEIDFIKIWKKQI